jgi:hypothetical protein
VFWLKGANNQRVHTVVVEIQMLVGGNVSMSASCLQHVMRVNRYGISHVLLISVYQNLRQ